jgi:DNA-binding FadR family transcriptional regulator
MSGFEYPQPTEIRHYDQLASWLRELIVGGQIPPGERLPGESERERLGQLNRW